MVKHQAVQVPGLTPTDKRAAKFRGAVEGLGIRKVVASAAVCEPPKPDSGMGGGPLRCAVAESPHKYQGRKPRGGRTLESGNAGAGSQAAGLHGNSSPCQEVSILAVQVSKS